MATTKPKTAAAANPEQQFKKALQTALRDLKPGDSPLYLLGSARTFGLVDVLAIHKIILEVLQDKASMPRTQHGGFEVVGHPSKNGDCGIILLPAVKKEQHGFLKLRRGFQEHLSGMSPRAVTLYIWLLLEARWKKGEKRGWVEGLSLYSQIATELHWELLAVKRAMAELRDRYVEIFPAHNQYEPTRIRIINYDGQEKQIAGDTSDTTKDKSAGIISDTTKDEPVSPVIPPKTKNDTSKQSRALKNQNLRGPKNVEEGKDREEERDPNLVPSPQPESTLDLADTWDTATSIFRRRVGRTLPPYPKDREKFDRLVTEYGEAIVLDAFTEWLKVKMDSLKKNNYGIHYFVDEPQHWIQDQLNKRQEEEAEKPSPVDPVNGSDRARDSQRGATPSVEHHPQCPNRNGGKCDCTAGNRPEAGHIEGEPK